MLFEGICVILLFAILIVTTLILTILVIKLLKWFVENLVRSCKREVLAQVREGTVPILERLDELEYSVSDLTQERFDEMFKDGFIPIRNGLAGIRHQLHMMDPSIVGEGSSYMTGAYVSRERGHSIHVFKNGSWELQEDFSRAGYEASRPRMDGSYEGQVVKTISGRAPEARS